MNGGLRMNELVICSDLTKRYSSLTALDHISLTLTPGRIVGLLGPNGSGKTTLIKILAGLLCPTGGAVSIAGNPVGPATKAVVSYLPDRMYYADWMKTKDLISIFDDFYEDFRRDRAESMCRTLGIRLTDRVKTMSKGTKEKLQLLLVMSRAAELYLLDEPIAGVDPAARDFILQTILANHTPNSTVLISTHLISDIESVLDDVIFLRQGRIVCQDTAEAIRQREGKSIDEVFRDVFRTIPMGGDGSC